MTLHNKCADRIPNNSFPGRDVLVNGKNFDALQLATRTLWEVKTDDFDKYNRLHSQEFVAQNEAAGNTARARPRGGLRISTSALACAAKRTKPRWTSWIRTLNICRHGLVLKWQSKRKNLTLIVYAPALVGDDGRPSLSSMEWSARFPACAWSGRPLKRSNPSHCRSAMRGSLRQDETGDFRSFATMTRITP